MKKKIVIITDCVDVAYTEMKLIIESECLKMWYSDLEFSLVPISEFSIINASFLVRLIAEVAIPWTILSVVINPQRNRSSRIYWELKNKVLFFWANTWALTWAIEDLWVNSLYEIHDPGFISFWGKFVHAPNVAKLVAGKDFDEFWVPFLFEKLTSLEIPDWMIVHIDNFGLMKIKWTVPQAQNGQSFRIYKNWEYILDAVFANRMMSLDDKQRSLYAWSSLAFPELWSVRNKDGYKEINAKIWDIITWELQ